MSLRTVTAAHGPEAFDALAKAIDGAKADDLLSRVTVVTPSPHASSTARHHLAIRGTCLVNVAFVSATWVAERLAPPPVDGATRRLTPLVRAALVRAVLEDHDGPLLAGLDGRALERSLEATFAELDEATPAGRRALGAVSPRAGEVLILHERFADRARSFTRDVDALDAAVAALGAGLADLAAVGHVVVFLPRVRSGGAGRLVEALAEHAPVTVVAAVDPPAVPVPRGEVAVVRAPDPEEEVRVAVRAVIDALATAPAEGIAVVAPGPHPHLLLLHERLTAAGVAHHGWSPLSLGQSVPGRTLLGLLRLTRHGFRRAEVARWLRSGPHRGPTGAPLDVARLDAAARRAGASAGVARWYERLDRRAAQLAQRLADAPDDRRARVEDDLAALAELRQVFDWLVALGTPPPAGGGWADHAAWARRGLEALLGPVDDVGVASSPWPDDEVGAYRQVLEVLDQASMLDEVAERVDAGRFRRALTDELSRPGRRVGRHGRGVFIGAPADLRGAQHDLVVVVGMVEGRYPVRGRDDPLLPDRERSRAGGALPARRTSASDQRDEHQALLASTPRLVLSHARADTRTGREVAAARSWSAARGWPGASLVDLPSFVAVLGSGGAVSDATEGRVAALLAGAPIATVGPDLVRGAAALADRLDGAASPWTGVVAPLPAGAPGGVGEPAIGSATRFEQWATCPFRYFLNHVLDVRAPDERGDADVISNPDRGTLVHEVLERFHGDDLARDPAKPFDPDDLARLGEVAAAVGQRFHDEGRTGRPLLWRLESEAITRRLETVAGADAAHRVERGVSPVAVEHRFGDDEGAVAPVQVELASGRRVAFRGSVDRIDRSPDGQRVVVLDYKTGSDRGYADLPKPGRRSNGVDITCHGRHLQLPLYAEAARQLLADDDPDIEAYFWFLDQSPPTLRGGVIGPAERERLAEVLSTIVEGIEGGQFPANPGEEGWFGPTNCGHCPYGRVCPPSRVDRWEALRRAPQLAAYVELSEG